MKIEKFKEFCFNNLLQYDLYFNFDSDYFYKYLKLDYEIYCVKQDIIFNLNELVKKHSIWLGCLLNCLYRDYKKKVAKQNKILNKYKKQFN